MVEFQLVGAALTSDLKRTMAACDVTCGPRRVGWGEAPQNIYVTEGVEQETACGLGSQAFEGALPCAK